MRRFRIVRQYFNDLENIVLSNIGKITKQDTAFVESAFSGYESVLEGYIDKIFEDGLFDFSIGAQLSYSTLTASDMPQNVAQRLALTESDHIRKYSRVSAFSVTDTTKNQMARIIEDNLQDMAEMVKQIKATFKDATASAHSRAMTIARTEVHSVASLGTLKGAIEGGATHKEWIWSGIERGYHQSIESQGPIPLNERFISGKGYSLDYPGDPSAPASEIINCTCDMEFLTLSDQEIAELQT